MVITQIQRDTPGRAYHQRERAEERPTRKPCDASSASSPTWSTAPCSATRKSLCPRRPDTERCRYLDRPMRGGCALAPLMVGATRESEELGNVGRRMSSTIIEGLAFHFTVFGMDSAEARLRAEAVVPAVEGALITAHALRSLSPFESMLAVLGGQGQHADGGRPKICPGVTLGGSRSLRQLHGGVRGCPFELMLSSGFGVRTHSRPGGASDRSGRRWRWS